jgi:hypothetical protein
VNFFVSDRPMFNATRHDQEFSFLDPCVAITKLHAEPALHYEEQLVFVVVVVPIERSQEFGPVGRSTRRRFSAANVR